MIGTFYEINTNLPVLHIVIVKILINVGNNIGIAPNTLA